MRYVIEKSPLSGSMKIPPSKSQTMRAILLASLAKGVSQISQPLTSPDVQAMIDACKSFGAKFQQTENMLLIEGVAGEPKFLDSQIDAKNSGQVLRFIAAIAALDEKPVTITGDESIQTRRPIMPLLTGLLGLGVDVQAKTGFAPVTVKGPVYSNVTYLDGHDSQPVSALLFLSMFLDQTTTIVVNTPGETPWIDMTLSWLDRFEVVYQNDEYSLYTVTGQKVYPAFNYQVPADFSSCAFPVIAALITQSEIKIENLDFDDAQGDKALFYLLQRLGANLVIEKDSIHVKKGPPLSGGVIDINCTIDALPILAVLGCFTEAPLHLCGAKIAREKESDRLSSIAKELTKMGARVNEYSDGLMIHPSNLKAAELKTYDDHRIAMALIVAAMAAEGQSVIEGVDCIEKSYPHFVEEMQKLGANIHEVRLDRI